MTQHLLAPLSREQTEAMLARITADVARDGWGLFAVEVAGALPFAGFVGLSRPRFEARFTPCHALRRDLLFRLQRGA